MSELTPLVDVPDKAEHTLVVRIGYDTKLRLDELANKLDRTTADVVRTTLRLGLPLLESLSDAEAQVFREYAEIFRKLRLMRTLRDI